MNNEIEIQLLFPKEVVLDNLDLNNLKVSDISQGYFTEDKIKSDLIPLLKSSKKELFFDCINGRVRKIDDKYLITLKNKMREDLSRDELEEEITFEQYLKLIPNSGSIKKKRYYLKDQYDLEIDQIYELNNLEFNSNFLIIEIEVLDTIELKEVRDFINNHKWLKYSYEISGSPLAKSFGMRKFCKNGYTNEAKKQVDSLIENILKLYK